MRHLLYVGTYERDYPRNALIIAALRRAGFAVTELHLPLWHSSDDKLAAIRPRAALRLALRLAAAYPRLALTLASRVRGADAVVIGYIGQADMLALAPLARFAGAPVIFNPLVTLTETLVEDRRLVHPRSLAARMLAVVDRLALHLASAVLADTTENACYLSERFGLPAERLRVLPVGADETVFSSPGSTVRGTSAPGGRLRVLFYGTMIPLHGAETIVRAAALLGDEVEVELIGQGQTLAPVRALAEELGATRVRFRDQIPYAELPDRIAASDVVLGIFGDTDKAARVVPNKVYQAMALGAAIVTRDSPAMRTALVDGVSALLVPPADPPALANALRRLRDPARRRALGEQARDTFLSCFALEAQAEALRAVIDGVCSPTGAGSAASAGRNR